MHWTTAPTPRPVRIARAAATVLRADPFAEPGPRGGREADPVAVGPVDDAAAVRAAAELDAPADAPADGAGRPPAQRPLPPPASAPDDTSDRGILRLRHADRA